MDLKELQYILFVERETRTDRKVSFYYKENHTQRWNDFDGIRIQRDMYSAFLIMNIADDLKSFNIDKCNDRFENFYRLHNLEVERLTGKKNLSSIAI